MLPGVFEHGTYTLDELLDDFVPPMVWEFESPGAGEPVVIAIRPAAGERAVGWAVERT